MALHFEFIFILCFPIILISTFLSYFFLTRIIKIEHNDFYDQWVRDGKPHGLPFYYPQGELQSGFRSGFQSNPWRKGNRWLFKTPEWMKDHEGILRMVKYFRISTFSVYFILLLLLISLGVSR